MLEKIQSSLLVFCLDDDRPHATPEDYSQVFSYLVQLFLSLFFFKEFIYLWLCWVFVALHGLSLQLWEAGCIPQLLSVRFSLLWLLVGGHRL